MKNRSWNQDHSQGMDPPPPAEITADSRTEGPQDGLPDGREEPCPENGRVAGIRFPNHSSKCSERGAYSLRSVEVGPKQQAESKGGTERNPHGAGGTLPFEAPGLGCCAGARPGARPENQRRKPSPGQELPHRLHSVGTQQLQQNTASAFGLGSVQEDVSYQPCAIDEPRHRHHAGHQQKHSDRGRSEHEEALEAHSRPRVARRDQEREHDPDEDAHASALLRQEDQRGQGAGQKERSDRKSPRCFWIRSREVPIESLLTTQRGNRRGRREELRHGVVHDGLLQREEDWDRTEGGPEGDAWAAT